MISVFFSSLAVLLLLLLLSIVFSHVKFTIFTQFAYTVFFFWSLIAKNAHSHTSTWRRVFAQGLPSEIHEQIAHLTNSAKKWLTISVKPAFVQIQLLRMCKQAYRCRSLPIIANDMKGKERYTIEVVVGCMCGMGRGLLITINLRRTLAFFRVCYIKMTYRNSHYSSTYAIWGRTSPPLKALNCVDYIILSDWAFASTNGKFDFGTKQGDKRAKIIWNDYDEYWQSDERYAHTLNVKRVQNGNFSYTEWISIWLYDMFILTLTRRIWAKCSIDRFSSAALSHHQYA